MASNFPFITDEQFERLMANGRMAVVCQARDEHFDPFPVLKLFTPDAGATWLLSELDEAAEVAFGLCDLGMGCPEIGYVGVGELAALRGLMNRPIEQDRHFRATQRLSAYAKEARMAGRIQA
ncbi:DUF2958 domain-containing protein [Variovorax rhizosphaerae]|uniref:DUF2958 domain-containing protein n=1 Tax=Variovorax rhizosphaerae TaxID=1836200 RepID=A0ABU8WXB2_9BURK